jgi:hypothetical protein
MAYLIAVLVFLSVLLSAGPSYAQTWVRMSPMEWGIDRLGWDYYAFDLQNADPALCQDFCFRDSRCMAWTYENPTPSYPRARCWLKQTVPAP